MSLIERRIRILARRYLSESARRRVVSAIPLVRSRTVSRVQRLRNDRTTLLIRMLGADEDRRRAAAEKLEVRGGFPTKDDGSPDLYEIAYEILAMCNDGRSITSLKYLLGRQRADEVVERLELETLHTNAARLLAESLHAEGHVRLAEKVASSNLALPEDEWLQAFRDRRRAEITVLDEGEARLGPIAQTTTSGGGVAGLYLLHNSLPDQSGGYATRTQGLLRGLQDHGLEVVGLTRPGFPSKHGAFDQIRGIESTHVVDGVTYHRSISDERIMPRSGLRTFAEHYSDLAEPWVLEHRPHIIHAASNWWNGFGGLALARRCGLPFVYEVRGLWELTKASREPAWMHSEAYQIDAIYEASVARAADRVLTISTALKNELIARGVDEQQIVVVPNATSTSVFHPQPRDEELVRRFNLDGKCVFGFAGTLTFYEGLDLLLEAARNLRRDGVADFAVLIVGDGPVLGSLKELAAEYQLLDHVHFVGRVPHGDVPRFLSVMDVTPFPRLPIPVCEIVPPIKPLEAMAMERTVIVSSVAALAEGVIDEETGLVFEAGDVASLQATMRRLIEDAALRSSLATNGLDWVRTHRSWEVVAKRVATVYQELSDAFG